jgi:hypothetical protein
MRLNFSHGSYEYHAGSIANLRSIMAGSKRACSIMLDTKGPEIRSGKVKGGNVTLKQGQKVVLTWDETFKDVEYDGSDGGKLYHDYTRITDSLVVGDFCLVDDGLIGLEVIAVEGNDLVTRYLCVCGAYVRYLSVYVVCLSPFDVESKMTASWATPKVATFRANLFISPQYVKRTFRT